MKKSFVLGGGSAICRKEGSSWYSLLIDLTYRVLPQTYDLLSFMGHGFASILTLPDSCVALFEKEGSRRGGLWIYVSG